MNARDEDPRLLLSFLGSNALACTHTLRVRQRHPYVMTEAPLAGEIGICAIRSIFLNPSERSERGLGIRNEQNEWGGNVHVRGGGVEFL